MFENLVLELRRIMKPNYEPQTLSVYGRTMDYNRAMVPHFHRIVSQTSNYRFLFLGI